ncbi:MAG: T9SS type A sorting domain-containing protein [Bacteroidales bacterium]|nr:T9SS type A sorting domain-containing protein [Bacteroidales bacterium]
MRHVLILTYLILLPAGLFSQKPPGTWSDHLVYTRIEDLALGSGEVFASTGSSLLIYDRKYDELRKLTRISGLSETEISTIAWSEESKTLVIAYLSTGLDLLRDNTIYHIPDISNKYIPGKKTINRIRTRGKYAYLACSFGIVVVDLVKKEISDTWKPGDLFRTAEVRDISFGDGDKIFAATDIGLYYAAISSGGLSYPGNWSPENRLPYPEGSYNAVLFYGGKLYANRSGEYFEGDSLYVIDSSGTLFSYEPGVFNSSVEAADGGFTVASSGMIRCYSGEGQLIRTINSYPWGSPDISMAAADRDLWIADRSSGLVRFRNMNEASALTLPGPFSNDAISINAHNGKTIICGGGVDASWNNLWKPFSLSVFENNSWKLITSAPNNDAMRVVFNPADRNHFFVSTWGTGLLEYRNNELINNYTDLNSPLQNIIPGKPFVRICGMAFDKRGYLWLAQPEVPSTLKALKPDGTWIVNPAPADVYTVGDLIITRTGHKWLLLPRGFGLFLLDDNDTPEIFSDDIHKKILVTDSENRTYPLAFSIAEDLDGNIWIGTDQGPVVYYSPERIFRNDLKAYRIRIPRSDGSGLADYLLGTETVTAIAVDGANRKWLGTSGSGVYLVSAVGTTEILNFNESNSPLLSNSILSISIDDKTGDVWFATSRGIQSFRGDATSGSDDFTDIFAFPNPVREDFQGNLTISGLMKDTRVSITDISGNLVYKTVSDGGTASWDLRTYNGRRVATGVYLIFCASDDGSRSEVIKVLVIN